MKKFLAMMFLASATGFAASPLAYKSPESMSIDGLTVSSYAALTSNYDFRGKSMSMGKPAVQAKFHINYMKYFSAGVFGSSVHLPDFPSKYINPTVMFSGGTPGVAKGNTGSDMTLTPLEDDTEAMLLKPYAEVSYDFGLPWHNATVGFHQYMFPNKKKMDVAEFQGRYEVYWKGFTFGGEYSKQLDKAKLDYMKADAAYKWNGFTFGASYGKSKSKNCSIEAAGTLKTGVTAPSTLAEYADALECVSIRGGNNLEATVAYTWKQYTVEFAVNKFTADKLNTDSDTARNSAGDFYEATSTDTREFPNTHRPESKVETRVTFSAEI